MIHLIVSVASLALMTACTKANDNTLIQHSSKSELSSLAAKASPISVSGPEIVIVGNSASFQLTSLAGVITSSTWTFGDGSASLQATGAANHTFNTLGLLNISITVTTEDGEFNANHTVNVIGSYDGMDCIPETSMRAPKEAYVGVPMMVSALIPDCFAGAVDHVTFSYGDGTSSGVATTHTYGSIGEYTVTMQVISPFDEYAPFITLTRTVQVLAAAPVPTPTPNPLACPTSGATRESMVGDIYDEAKTCGVGGSKTDKYQVRLVEECRATDGVLLWAEVSRTPVLQSEGECLKQSCKLPDGSYLADGQSRTLYSTSAPASSCSSVSAVRSCANGVISGSESFTQLSCHNGCEGFGAHGTVKTGVLIGSVPVPKTCSFGEEGISDIYQQVADQTCTDGSVKISNTRQGSLVTAGACPTYSYAATDAWTTCDANCGGKQNRIFECRDAAGHAVDAARCGTAAPSVARVCDANPSAAGYVESSSADEESGSSGSCPKDQIGVTIATRTTTTVKTYACIDHAVSLASTAKTSTAWVTESYCRDYVAHRCSQDSLSTTDAQNRYKWMLKCQDQVPVIKQFLVEFDDVKVKGNYSIDEGSRRVYPTFMNRATNPEKPWIAPKVATASCTVPSTAYIAAVCLSSCATPEQEIIAQVQANAKLKKVSFIEALTKNYGFVGTLKSNSAMTSMDIKKTKVDQWVTELIDTDHDILHFRTASGGEVRLTPNHPVIAADGSVKLAETFKVGDSLVRLGGHLDQIVAIDHEVHYGKVYNLFVNSASLQENVVVTGGFLNGTAFFQNEGAKNMNREVLRTKLVRGILN